MVEVRAAAGRGCVRRVKYPMRLGRYPLLRRSRPLIGGSPGGAVLPVVVVVDVLHVFP